MSSKSLVKHLGLNPFEVREVLQGASVKITVSGFRLNPFEVREVLQDKLQPNRDVVTSQSL